MNWSWYLACEMQFFLILPSLVQAYYRDRPKFWFLIIFWWAVANIMALSIIINNDLSASYFTYKDEYWTLFYEKPYARLPCYLVGVVWGCSYYSYKYEDDEDPDIKQRIAILQTKEGRIDGNQREQSAKCQDMEQVLTSQLQSAYESSDAGVRY